ncbi:MAG: hypothetical protein KDC92_13075 [Bacteroidetes bacterium]|nr:hypothetical protein [Bacteroidota bacterium]
MSKKASKKELLRRKRQVDRNLFLKKSAKKTYVRPAEFAKENSEEKAAE